MVLVKFGPLGERKKALILRPGMEMKKNPQDID
jgi:hypothetical protein